VDRLNEGGINFANLKAFFRNNYSYPTEKEIMCVIRRIDTDGDAKVSYSEFSDYMKLLNPISSSKLMGAPYEDKYS
jgi:Ca2+-binding EF-hand superfamily protein